MATGRERRAERLNERLRGAQRADVADDSFNLDIPGLDLPPAPVDETPEPSAKKPRLNGDGPSSQRSTRTSSGRRRSTRSATKSPYDLPDTSKESDEQRLEPAPAPISPGKPSPAAQSSAASSRSRRSIVSRAEANPEPDVLETLPAQSSPTERRRSFRNRLAGEIAESPVQSSDRQSRAPASDVLSSSARLRDVLSTDEPGPPSSSPLRSKALRRASVRSARQSAMDQVVEADEDELSPDRPAMIRPMSPSIADEPGSEKVHEADEDAEGEEEPVEPEEIPEDEEVEPEEESEVPEQDEEEEPEEAEEIGVEEAAQRLGRKRPRESLARVSPELGSSMMEDVEESPPKRRRGRPTKSPATQKQPAPKKTKTTHTKAKDGKSGKSRRRSDDGDDPAIEITVQGFVHNKKGQDASDPTQSGIPFANHSGESVIDVFAQVCEEVIGTALAQFEELANGAADAAKKKESRIKIRAVEAYREELSSRLLEHAIQLNHWYSLRKRVRHTQKEKLALREEILRLKAEREQVALRMDEVRIKHEEDSKDSTYRLNVSDLMHDIDLAVEQGREAPELSRAEQKQADLANLELLVAQMVDQASSTSSAGGLLRQVKDFNAFLERAAVALETR